MAVSREIYDETVGIFYHSNRFEFYFPTQLHAFILSLGSQRLSFIRDVTLHYTNLKSGGINLADLTFPLLKQLTGLRRLHIQLESRLYASRKWWNSGGADGVDNANPCEVPGFKVLFALRGITDIQVRDDALEEGIEVAKQQPSWPTFDRGTGFWCWVELERILRIFNIAIANAQKGKVCRTMLDDKDWHLKKGFTIDE